MTLKRDCTAASTVPHVVSQRCPATPDRIAAPVLFEIDDELRRTGRQDALERVRLRLVVTEPDQLDERIERRPRNAVTYGMAVRLTCSRVKLSLTRAG